MTTARKSLEQKRKAVLTAMSKNRNAKAVQKTIRFRNEDVPNFLKRLEQFEEASARSELIAR